MAKLRISPAPAPSRKAAMTALKNAFLADEAKTVRALIDNFPLNTESRDEVAVKAAAIVAQSRAMKEEQGTLDAFLAETWIAANKACHRAPVA